MSIKVPMRKYYSKNILFPQLPLKIFIWLFCCLLLKMKNVSMQQLWLNEQRWKICSEFKQRSDTKDRTIPSFFFSLLTNCYEKARSLLKLHHIYVFVLQSHRISYTLNVFAVTLSNLRSTVKKNKH